MKDRGLKGDWTPIMEAASAGHTDIVRYKICWIDCLITPAQYTKRIFDAVFDCITYL